VSQPPTKTILCVDDSPTELLVLTEALSSLGCRVVTAGDGEDALLQAVACTPDLILLDVVLPKKNGFQVCRQLKSAAPTRGIKIVIVTAKDQPSDRFWGLKQGADDYVTKPVAVDELLTLVRRHLNQGAP
jgi:DNA-binding response OmpR family regulator